ncbi:MAG: UDP-3-O-(3-hydroxymyristoyl)glucosamine N-acyltransferase [Bacteroidales bacterium]|jgi:UDP-3-O-[3-hydroxymyristoyl] glucosamine N-acyltransferase|nr:UDP-3-O-(3-hydroxymyristoyl)glucosamine N-acyltransferase [Bacteroidales bacterium]
MNFPQTLTVSQVAAIIDGKIIGVPEQETFGLNELHVVRPGDVTFVDHPKYYDKVLKSAASVIIINKEIDAPENKSLIYHPKPFDAFKKLILHFRPFVASSAMVSPSAKIGEGTVIQPGAFVGNQVTIGTNCIIHANVTINDHSVIGNNVIIQPNSVIGGDGYYFQRRPEGYVKFESGGRVILEDNVEIGASCTIDKGVTGDTTIGAGTKMDNQCQVGHDTIIGKNCLIGAFAAIAGVTVIEDDVLIWARVAINKDIVVGAKSIILATSALDKSVEGGKVYMGSPAVEVRQYWKELAAIRQLPELIKKIK